MKNNYLLPGIAAIMLAILFPTLIIFEILSLSDSSWKDIFTGMKEWRAADSLFIVLGLLSIFVFYNFKKILNEQLNFKSIDILLWIMIGLNFLFHIVLVLADGYVGLSGKNLEVMGMVITGLTVSTLLAFGIVDLLIGAMLLLNHQKRPKILAVLGIVSIFLGAFELAFPLIGLVLIVFPIYMIILAIYFLRKPETIEVV